MAIANVMALMPGEGDVAEGRRWLSRLLGKGVFFEGLSPLKCNARVRHIVKLHKESIRPF